MEVMTKAVCSECEADVPISGTARINEITECPTCRSELEILSVNPPLLALAPEIEEDWGE